MITGNSFAIKMEEDLGLFVWLHVYMGGGVGVSVWTAYLSAVRRQSFKAAEEIDWPKLADFKRQIICKNTFSYTGAVVGRLRRGLFLLLPQQVDLTFS